MDSFCGIIICPISPTLEVAQLYGTLLKYLSMITKLRLEYYPKRLECCFYQDKLCFWVHSAAVVCSLSFFKDFD